MRYVLMGMREEIKRYGFLKAIIILCFSMSFGLRGIEIYGVKVLELLLIVYTVADFLSLLVGNKRSKISPALLGVYCLMLTILVGIIVNGSTEDTAVTCLRLFIGLLVFNASSKESFRCYHRFVSFGLVLSSHYLLFRNLNQVRVFFSGGYSGIFMNRMSMEGSFGNPNFLANYLLIPYSLGLWNLFQGIMKKKNFLVMYGVATSIVTSIMMLLTASRGSLISLLIISICYFLWYIKERRLRLGPIFFTVTMFAMLISLILFFAEPIISPIVQRFAYHELLSGSGRDRIFRKAFDIFRENPWFGIGIGNFKHVSGARTHNLYLELLTETGLVGFVSFGFIIYVAVRSAGKGIAIAYKFALLGLLINGFSINMLDLRHLWLILGMLNSGLGIDKKEDTSKWENEY